MPRTSRIAPAIFVIGIIAPATPVLFSQTAPAIQTSATQPTTTISTPIAIVPLDNANNGPTVTGALEVTSGKAIIAASGSVTSSTRTTEVVLPRRGTLRVCASTTVKLATDSSVPTGDSPGLLMAMDAGAVEMSFATSNNADILLTPDFRILIGGPGASEVKVRLGSAGDTCIDNSGADAPYVVVNSLFDSGLYRVQPGQRVMLQHGNLHEVVDQEKEPCGCPPEAAKTTANEFPLAQSEGLAPTPAFTPVTPNQGSAPQQVAPPLVYSSPAAMPQAARIPTPSASPSPVPTIAPTPVPTPQKKQPGVFTRLGHFLKRIFGAE